MDIGEWQTFTKHHIRFFICTILLLYESCMVVAAVVHNCKPNMFFAIIIGYLLTVVVFSFAFVCVLLSILLAWSFISLWEASIKCPRTISSSGLTELSLELFRRFVWITHILCKTNTFCERREETHQSKLIAISSSAIKWFASAFASTKYTVCVCFVYRTVLAY